MNSHKNSRHSNPTRPGMRVPPPRVNQYHGKADPADELIGISIHDRFVVHEKIGEGGMAAVYWALDTQTDQKVAVKIILPKHATDMNIVNRFYREARATLLATHPNVVRTFDVGTYKDRTFLVMELLQGEDINDIISREKRLEWKQAKPMLLEFCDALYSVHQRGIVHRDLKPHNIFLAQAGGRKTVKLIDFGMAKKIKDGEKEPAENLGHARIPDNLDDRDEDLTSTGMLMGTLAYMAPEQTTGKKGGYDHRADIYAAGIIMYKMLTGAVPFKGESFVETIDMHRNIPPEDPRMKNPDIPAGVSRIILKALAKKPENRYQTMLELREDILNDGIVIRPAASRPQAAEESGAVERDAIRSMPDLSEMKRRKGASWISRIATLGLVAGIAALAYNYQVIWRPHAENLFSYAKGQYEMHQNPASSQPSASSSIKPAGSALAPKKEAVFEATVLSKPDGASVYREGKDKVLEMQLGKTPLTIRLPKDSRMVTLVVRKRGYPQRRVTVSPESPGVSIDLRTGKSGAVKPE